jgi:hypothetical protein
MIAHASDGEEHTSPPCLFGDDTDDGFNIGGWVAAFYASGVPSHR